MADTTISALTPGTPAGSGIVPYSTGTSTLGTAVSALFHNAGNIGIGTTSPGSNKLTVIGSLSASGQINGLSMSRGAGGAAAAGNMAIGDARTLANVSNASNINSNVAIGVGVMAALGYSNGNTAVGYEALNAHNTYGIGGNTAMGNWALKTNQGQGNTAIGSNAMRDCITGSYNVVVGNSAMANSIAGQYNVAIGSNVMGASTTGRGNSNVAIGYLALNVNDIGGNNVAIGKQSLVANLSGHSNIGLGDQSLQRNTTGSDNIGMGSQAIFQNTTGSDNIGMGDAVFYSNTTGSHNIGIGSRALFQNVTGTYNTAIGYQALYTLGNTQVGPADPATNCSALGNGANVTASNQVQLGNAATTAFAYGAVAVRSDVRDKADVRDTALGLQFINALRPVDFKWDYREDYRTQPPMQVHKPAELQADASDADRVKHAHDVAQHDAYVQQHASWVQSNRLGSITHDGSKKRNRYHHGLIAQEVETVLQNAGIDFGGYQNHAIAGGDDVKSIGYAELIAPLIKAVQELAAKVTALENRH